MIGRIGALAMALVLFSAACGEAPSADDGRPISQAGRGALDSPDVPDSAAVPGDPIDPAELSGDVKSLTIDGTTYWLGIGPDGCVALTIETAGSVYTPLRGECRDGLDETIDCAYRPPFERPPATAPPGVIIDYAYPACEVSVPAVTVGRVGPGPDLVCLAQQEGERFGPVQFVKVEGGRTYLVEGRTVVPFPYTADGHHYGEPPLDGPAASIYALCDASGPWVGSPSERAFVEVVVLIDEELVRTGGLFVDYGTGPEFFEFLDPVMGLVFEPSIEQADIEVRFFRSVDTFDSALPVATYRFPDGLIADLSSGWQCFDGYHLVMEIDAAVADLDPSAIVMTYLDPAATADLVGDSDLFGIPAGSAPVRSPGEPCPDSGREREAAERPDGDVGFVVEMNLDADVDPSWFVLGSEYALWIVVEELEGSLSGAVMDFEHLATNDEDATGPWGFFAPGMMVHLGIDRPEAEHDGPGDEWVRIRIPDLPAGWSEDSGMQLVLRIVVGPGDVEARLLDAGAISFDWTFFD